MLMGLLPALLCSRELQHHPPVPSRDAATVAFLLLHGLFNTASTCTWAMHLVPNVHQDDRAAQTLRQRAVN